MNDTKNLDPQDRAKPAKKNRFWLFLAWASFIGLPLSWACLAMFDAGYTKNPLVAAAALPYVVLLIVSMALPVFAPRHIRYAASDDVSFFRSFFRGKLTFRQMFSPDFTGVSPELDEWEIHARHKALAVGHRATSLMFAAALFLFIGFAQDMTFVSALFMTMMLFALHALVPPFYLAQTISPPDSE